MKRLLIVLVLLQVSIGNGQNTFSRPEQVAIRKQRWATVLDRTKLSLSAKSIESKNRSSSCIRFYDDFLGGKSRLETQIHVFFGYIDGLNETIESADLPMRLALRDELTKPCQSSIFACGFREEINSEPSSQSLLTTLRKVLTVDGVQKSVVIRLFGSAIGLDRMSIAQSTNEQLEASHWAERKFVESFDQSQMLLYLGHSRSGGGPDFYPPAMSYNDQVDYAYYLRDRRGVQLLTEGLKRAKSDLKILGLHSCTSEEQFSGLVKKMKPNLVQLYSPRLIGFDEEISTVYSSLNAVLSRSCKDEFSQSIQVYNKGFQHYHFQDPRASLAPMTLKSDPQKF
jgi:hypothetical protein